MEHLKAGTSAPDFSLKTVDGKEMSLHLLLQRGPVLAAFYKHSCPVCQFTFPFIERLHQRYGTGDVTFLGVSQDDSQATKEFAKNYKLTFPVVMDSNGYPASNAYGLTNVPTIFLIDTDGKIKTAFSGFDKKGLEEIAAELATRQKSAATALFLPSESIPAYKPG